MHIQSSVLKSLVENREKKEKQLFAQSLYRLKKSGFIKDIGNGVLEFNHKKYILEKGTSMYFEKSKTAQGVMVMFDIPEEMRHVREWLRRQLILWGFVMIQKSVWFGKGSLTKDFKNHLEILGIKKCVKIFSATQIKV